MLLPWLTRTQYRLWFRHSEPGIWAQAKQTQCSQRRWWSGSHFTWQGGIVPPNNGQVVTGHFSALFCDTMCVWRLLGWVCQLLLVSHHPTHPTKAHSRNGIKLSIPWSTQEHRASPGWVAQSVGALSWYTKVAGSIPHQGTHKNQPVNG